MKSGKIALIIIILVLLGVAGGLVWLSKAPLMPPIEQTEQVIPDDRIPR